MKFYQTLTKVQLIELLLKKDSGEANRSAKVCATDLAMTLLELSDFEKILDKILRFSCSRYGFIEEISNNRDDTTKFIRHAYIKNSWDERHRCTFHKTISDGAIKMKEVFVCNTASLANMNLRFDRFIGIPLVLNSECLGVLGLANKQSFYTEEEIKHLTLFGKICAEKLFAVRENNRKNIKERELKKLYTNLQTKSVRIMETERLRSIGTMVGGVAHELNNPLMGVINYIQYCIKHTRENDKLFEILQGCEHETKRCIKIISNLLMFSRININPNDDTKSVIDIGSLLDQVLELLNYQIVNNHIIIQKKYLDSSSPKIFAKDKQIQQVFLNLILNSIDALKTAAVKEICIDASIEGDEWLNIVVSDTGSGINREDLNLIFEPFFTTKSVGEGTGLGLSIAHGVIASHGGTIFCTSEINKGSTMHIKLPIGDGEREEEDGEKEQSE